MTNSQHTKLTLEIKILPTLLPEFELATFLASFTVAREWTGELDANQWSDNQIEAGSKAGTREDKIMAGIGGRHLSSLRMYKFRARVRTA